MSINLYPESWPDDLQHQITDWSEQFPSAYVYALIEGVHNETCYPLIKKLGLTYHALYSGLANADEETLGLSPILVKYEKETQARWFNVLQKTSGLPALSVIITPETITEISNRLFPWCVVKAANYALTLAFADVRILPVLISALTPDQHAQFYGPVIHWQYLTRKAEWKLLPSPKQVLPPALEVKLDEAQCAQLMKTAEADSVLFQLRVGAANVVDCFTPARAHELVSYWLTCADHAQIEASSERISLCELGLTHPELEQHPKTIAWLTAPSQPHPLDFIIKKLTEGISQ